MAKSSSSSGKTGGSAGSSVSSGKTGGSADGKELKKAPSGSTGSSGSSGGFWSNLFGGSGSSGSSSGSSSNSSGTGKDRVYTDPKTGQRFNEPSYPGRSLRGLTSTDPANVARNRYHAERYAAMSAERDAYRNNKDSKPVESGIPAALPPEPPKPTQAELASIGMANAPVAPTEVAPPVYGLPGIQPVGGDGFGNQPTGSYGDAFSTLGTAGITPVGGEGFFAAEPLQYGSNVAPASPLPYDPYLNPGVVPYNPFLDVNLVDIFNAFPTAGTRG